MQPTFIAQQAPTTTTTPSEETTTTTTTEEDSDGVFEKVGDVVDKVKDVVGDADKVPDPIEQIAGVPLDVLNEAAGELAGTAFGDLAEIGLEIGDPTELVILGLTSTVHVLAGFVAFAAIATAVLFLVLAPKRKFGTRISYLSASVVKFLLISSVGVTLAVAMVELSGELTTSAIEYTLPDEVDVADANVYDAGLAVVIVPLVGMAFEFQRFFVGILIAFWPLAAAVSITKSFKHALPIFTALLVANIAWPPLAALAVGKAFEALPSVGAASWWCLGAVAIAPLTNAIALAARANN